MIQNTLVRNFQPTDLWYSFECLFSSLPLQYSDAAATCNGSKSLICAQNRTSYNLWSFANLDHYWFWYDNKLIVRYLWPINCNKKHQNYQQEHFLFWRVFKLIQVRSGQVSLCTLYQLPTVFLARLLDFVINVIVFSAITIFLLITIMLW